MVKFRNPSRMGHMSHRALDLYAGIGGWTLGLELAGIETVKAYEWWNEANDTHLLNFPEVPFEPGDIRKLPLSAFPADVDLIVGSPPCTQFSFANRGGNGDLADGLRDIEKFLEVVAAIQPKHWVMENVPRVAGILTNELEPGGSLEGFSGLFTSITVVNMADYGLPQRRKRMLAGDFSADVLESYVGAFPARTLGDVMQCLASTPARDPIYGFELDAAQLSDHHFEPPLTEEEARMNRDAKRFHPVYNRMSFPDRLGESARTVTATCTRVSRESIVVEDTAHPDRYRRLSVRERASLQAFPITYQFAGRTYPAKLKMVGNAFPPLMAFFVAHAMLETPRETLLDSLGSLQPHPLPSKAGTTTKCAGPVSRYPAHRRFRAAVPSLRFGSGVRFELTNHFDGDQVTWRMAFLYGSSKSIQNLVLDDALLGRVRGLESSQITDGLIEELRATLDRLVGALGPVSLQARWNWSTDEGAGPHDLVDGLGAISERLVTALQAALAAEPDAIVLTLLGDVNGSAPRLSEKLHRHAYPVLAGILVGSVFNSSVLARAEAPKPLPAATQ